MSKRHWNKGVSLALAALALGACSVMELSGSMTKKTGEAMTEYSKNNDGLIGKAAGLGGKINTTVGGAVEDAARSGKGASGSEKAVAATSRGADEERISNIETLPADIGAKLTAEVAQNKKRQACAEGCKDFVVWCSVPSKASAAERAKGISEAWFVGLQWQRFGKPANAAGGTTATESAWHTEKHLTRIAKEGSRWFKDKAIPSAEHAAICKGSSALSKR